MSKLRFIEEEGVSEEYPNFTSDDDDENGNLNYNKNIQINESSDDKEVFPTLKTSKVASQTLFNFLSVKRKFTIPPAPEILESNDEYILEFNKSFLQSKTIKDKDDEDDDFYNITSDSPTVLDSTIEPVVDTNVTLTGPKIKIFNLLYAITTEQLRKFGEKYGCVFEDIELLIDHKTKLPLGSAIVTLSSMHEIVDDVIKALHGQSCMGRPVRVVAMNTSSTHSKHRSELNGVNRYFDSDISTKCNNCGQVGHRKNECTNDPLSVPCHLCGSRSHDGADCENIICFRCNEYGHHSKSCSNKGRNKKVIYCTLCGVSGHHTMPCLIAECVHRSHIKIKNNLKNSTATTTTSTRKSKPQEIDSENISRYNRHMDVIYHTLYHEKIQCMTCFQSGHSICENHPLLNKLKEDPPSVHDVSKIFCPNCGVSGHHVHYPEVFEYNTCKAPKYDAYNKFNPLLKLLEDPKHGGANDIKHIKLYEQLTKYQSDVIMQWFPCLHNRTPSHFTTTTTTTSSYTSHNRGSDSYNRYEEKGRNGRHHQAAHTYFSHDDYDDRDDDYNEYDKNDVYTDSDDDYNYRNKDKNQHTSRKVIQSNSNSYDDRKHKRSTTTNTTTTTNSSTTTYSHPGRDVKPPSSSSISNSNKRDRDRFDNDYNNDNNNNNNKYIDSSSSSYKSRRVDYSESNRNNHHNSYSNTNYNYKRYDSYDDRNNVKNSGKSNKTSTNNTYGNTSSSSSSSSKLLNYTRNRHVYHS